MSGGGGNGAGDEGLTILAWKGQGETLTERGASRLKKEKSNPILGYSNCGSKRGVRT